MAIPRSRWALVIALLPMLTPGAAPAQTSAGKAADPATEKAPAPRKPAAANAPRRSGRGLPRASGEDYWNPYYSRGERSYDEGRYAESLHMFEQSILFFNDTDLTKISEKDKHVNECLGFLPIFGLNPREWLRFEYLLPVGAALAALGRYDEAERRFIEKLAHAERCFPGRWCTNAGISYQGLAFLHAARGRYDEAADTYRLALAHVEKNEPQTTLPPPSCVAMILTALADVEIARGRLDAAEPCLSRAVAVQQAQEKLRIGPSPLERAAVLIVFAHLRFHQARYSEAYDLDTDALTLIRDIREDHPLAGFCLDGLGEVELVRKHFDRAEGHFREALKVREAGLGKEHRELASSLDGLGRVAAARGDRKAAEERLDRAETILVRALGPGHPDAEEVAAHAKALGRRPDGGAERPAARFLAIPTLPTLGWQIGYRGKDWRATAASLLRKEARASKGARPAPTPAKPVRPSDGR